MVPSGRSETVGVTSAEARSSVWLIDANKRYAGHRAVGRVFTGQTGLWKLLGYLILGLGPISALGYALVAANRHRLPGGTKECVVIHD